VRLLRLPAEVVLEDERTETAFRQPGTDVAKRRGHRNGDYTRNLQTTFVLNEDPSEQRRSQSSCASPKIKFLEDDAMQRVLIGEITLDPTRARRDRNGAAAASWSPR
jgi:hypothetical protein